MLEQGRERAARPHGEAGNERGVAPVDEQVLAALVDLVDGRGDAWGAAEDHPRRRRPRWPGRGRGRERIQGPRLHWWRRRWNRTRRNMQWRWLWAVAPEEHLVCWARKIVTHASCSHSLASHVLVPRWAGVAWLNHETIRRVKLLKSQSISFFTAHASSAVQAHRGGPVHPSVCPSHRLKIGAKMSRPESFFISRDIRFVWFGTKWGRLIRHGLIAELSMIN